MEQTDPVAELEAHRAYWDSRASSFGSHCGRGPYVQTFLRNLDLQGDEVILDMGCGSGTFAVPLAQDGHTAIACDFSPKMIEQVELLRDAEQLPITTHILAWQDDWSTVGLDVKCVDVAIASRCLQGGQELRPCLEKLDNVARQKVAVTVSATSTPGFNVELRRALGRTTEQGNSFMEVITELVAMGRFPKMSYIAARRPMEFATYEEACADLLRAAGREPLSDVEQERFDAFCAQHFRQVDRDGQQLWELDYPINIVWAFITWNTDGTA